MSAVIGTRRKRHTWAIKAHYALRVVFFALLLMLVGSAASTAFFPPAINIFLAGTIALVVVFLAETVIKDYA